MVWPRELQRCRRERGFLSREAASQEGHGVPFHALPHVQRPEVQRVRADRHDVTCRLYRHGRGYASAEDRQRAGWPDLDGWIDIALLQRDEDLLHDTTCRCRRRG